ncbi:MAG: hypothetical protein AB1730_07325 [Myxococcota bacterium]
MEADAAKPNLTVPGDTGAQLALTEPITTVIGDAPARLTREQALDDVFERASISGSARTQG